MARPRQQASSGGTPKPSVSAAKQKDVDGKTQPQASPPPATRCWQSGARRKEASVAESPPQTGPGAAPVSIAAVTKPSVQRGFAEVPAAERASRRQQLQDMGFSASAAQQALESCAWDVNEALDRLFNPKHDQSKPSSSPYSNGDSTSASGGSTPRLPTSAYSSDGSVLEQSPVPLPPGLERMSVLAVPPGLQDELTPCQTSECRPSTEWASASAFKVPSSAVHTTGSLPAGASPVSIVPKRRLQKVQHTWECEEICSTTQLGVEEGTFVYVWTDSKTPTGWIYAESLICCSRAGWMPASMLQPLPPGKMWMRISTPCQSTHPLQLHVEAGNMILLDATQVPVNGWVYADQVASATGRPSLQGLIGAGGWVPIQCVKWAEV